MEHCGALARSDHTANVAGRTCRKEPDNDEQSKRKPPSSSSRSFGRGGMSMRARTLRVTAALLVVGAGGAGYLAYRGVNPKVKATTDRTVTAATGTVAERIAGTGTVQATTAVSLSFSSSGKLIELAVVEGQDVKKGDLLAKIDPTTAQNQLDAAKSNVATALAKLAATRAGLSPQERRQIDVGTAQGTNQLEIAQKSLDQTEVLLENNKISYAATVDQARATLDNATTNAVLNATNYQAAVDAAKNTLDNARANADLNAKAYETSIANATAGVDNARATADLNAKSYQAAVDQAQLAVDNAKTNAGLNVGSSNQSLSQLQNQANADATAVAELERQLQIAAANLTSATPENKAALTAAYNQLLQSVAAAQKSAQNSVNALNNAQNSANASAVKDAQNVLTVQQTTLTNALNSQSAGLAKDAQSIKTAELAIANALAARETGKLKDQQSIQAAEQSLTNALNSQNAGVTKDQQAVRSAQTALDNAGNTQIANVEKDQQTLVNARNTVKNAELSLRSTRAGNAVKLAPAKASDVATALASLEQARVAVTTAQRSLDDTALYASVDGTITAIANQVGESVGSSGSGASGSSSSSSGLFQITSTRGLEAKAGLSEANAAKAKVGQAVTVTFDALPNVTVDASIATIDPLATTVNNVATYYATLAVPGAAELGVKPGMTAQVSIVVNERTDVVLLPANAVTGNGRRKFVTILKAGIKTVTPVETGITGDAGTEITSGVSDGDVVVLPVQQVTTANRARSSTGGLTGGGAVPGGGGPPPGGGGR